MNFEHVSVMLHECIDGLAIRSGGTYIDGTAGGGGHSLEIAKQLGEGGRLIAIDRDPAAIEAAGKRLEDYSHCTTLVNANFSEIPDVLDKLGVDAADGILLDLGVSSHQLDNAERGFSYQHDARLDMRMGREGLSAYDVVNNYPASELARIFRQYGEERYASAIARGIERAKIFGPINTTSELVEIIKKSIPAAARREGGHPAKRVFQAIRIEVNGELEHLKRGIDEAFERLAPGGRFVIITFHSLEDRLVKRAFAAFCTGCTCPPHFPVCVCGKTPRAKLVGKQPMIPSQEEQEQNRRSHSAKLRILEKR